MTGETSNTAVYLTDEEARQFLEFRQHYSLYCKILEQVLDKSNRTVTLHLDDDGVRLIETRRFFN